MWLFNTTIAYRVVLIIRLAVLCKHLHIYYLSLGLYLIGIPVVHLYNYTSICACVYPRICTIIIVLRKNDLKTF